MSQELALKNRYEFALRIAADAGQITERYFQQPFQVDQKEDGSPVTIADREAETLLRKLINKEFPDDGVLGEEFGEESGSSGFRWILDPIDGTKSFVSGVPLYTTLIGVLENDEPRIGVISAPALGEMIHARIGHGSLV